MTCMVGDRNVPRAITSTLDPALCLRVYLYIFVSMTIYSYFKALISKLFVEIFLSIKVTMLKSSLLLLYGLLIDVS